MPINKVDFPNNEYKKGYILIFIKKKGIYFTKTENLKCAKVCEPF